MTLKPNTEPLLWDLASYFFSSFVYFSLSFLAFVSVEALVHLQGPHSEILFACSSLYLPPQPPLFILDHAAIFHFPQLHSSCANQILRAHILNPLLRYFSPSSLVTALLQETNTQCSFAYQHIIKYLLSPQNVPISSTSLLFPLVLVSAFNPGSSSFPVLGLDASFPLSCLLFPGHRCSAGLQFLLTALQHFL